MREELDGMADWLSKQDGAWFAQDVSFTASSGKASRMKAADILTHMFTHFNHHRGQVSTAITQMDGIAPEMDYVYYLRYKTGP
jgi:uncharacterized damage-inducible protein DinB